ncbi:MAG: tRNA (adenosine(37)-N6)-dimethylallyltransferase MiaA, partial [Clostridia bacterium]|nr:tRNA (adenosine(37)-N6)-dimethylallyltransferase MiaA [Clostridia bacterium]
MKDVIVITGPTASGKTSVALEIARKINAEIINADSMQIFKRCNIGTAKPSEKELSEIRHHLIDIIEPDQTFSVASYKDMAESAIQNIIEYGKNVVITGGTGMYIDALVKNMDFTLDDGRTPIREKYNKMLIETSPQEIHSLLEKRDHAAAETVHPNNVRRVIRYLEILDGFDGSLDEYMKKTRTRPSDFNYHIFILWPDREFVYERIEKRVDDMLATGLVDEVKGLLESGIKADMQSMQGIGYKETIGFINGKFSYEEYVELLKRNTRRYAKRQFTWL